MALRSDNQGFLVGEPVDISKAVNQLRAIRSDVAAIKGVVIGAVSNVHNNRSGSSNPIVSGRSSSNSTVATPSRPRSSSQGSVSLSPAISGQVATPNMRGRDASGRFAGNTGSGNQTPSPNETPEERSQRNLLSGIAGRIATVAAVSTAGAEEADPTIKAFKEVSEPMRRGYEILTGSGDKKEGWFKKIFKELNLFRKDESVFNRVANRSLHNIEGNPGGGSGDSSGGIMLVLAGLLGRLGPMLLTGITAVLGFIFSPIGLAIGAASAVAWGLFTESGQKFFGEVGAKIIAGWDSVVTAFAPITESIGKGWDTVKSGFDSLISGMTSSWDAFPGFLKDKFGIDIPAIFKPVVDVSKKAVEAAKETVNAGADMAKNTAGKALEAVEKSSPKTTEALGNLWGKAKEGAGKIKFHATEKGNAETAMKVLMGKGWTKEQAAGIAANLAAESGFDTDATGDNGKAKGIAQWHPDRQKKFEEVNGKKLSEATLEEQVGFVDWELRNTEKKAGDKIRTAATAEQAAALTERHYERSALGLKGGVQPERIANASKYASLDIAKESEQPKTPPATPSFAEDPTQGGRFKYEALEGGKVQVTDNQTGVMELANDEQANAYRKQQGKPYLDKVAAINAGNMPLYHSLAVGPGAASQTQTAFAAAPKVPTFTPAPVPAEAPPQITPLASLGSGRNMTVTMPTPDVGQDVKDRGIAHIATGGLSGRG